jgi:LPXTG-motif cell wall-anchored protein
MVNILTPVIFMLAALALVLFVARRRNRKT